MYELIQVSDNCYYFQCPAKIGLVTVGNGEAVLIDSGSDKDAGRKVRQALDANGWKLTPICNTHSNADHIGAYSRHTPSRLSAFASPSFARPFLIFSLTSGTGSMPFTSPPIKSFT